MTKDEEQIVQIQERMDYLSRKIRERRATGRACDLALAIQNEDELRHLKGMQRYFINHLEKTRGEEDT